VSRIIAGSHRGRQLTMPAGGKTRPTTDRVREALFSAVTAWAGSSSLPPAESLSGLSFCDLYAGSGAVGLEAASRGAAPVLLVEGDRRTAQTAGKNVESLGLAARVRTSRVEPLVRSPAELAFDVVFADPPYDLETGSLEAVLQALVDQGWVAADGLIVVERSRRTPELRWPPSFRDTWARRYGETTLLFARGEPAGADDPDPADVVSEAPALPAPPNPEA
jgi:16S rRNA (guanine966-N2)-methyltransferase